jgi:uncharacterized phage-associated protein
VSYIALPPYDARAVANYFLDLAKRDGKTLDPMKIQKLVYLAHGWSLALTGKPLIVDKIEAWPYGPVIRSLYSAFKDAGSGPIEHPAFDVHVVDGKLTATAPKLDDIEHWSNSEIKSLLDEVWRVYGDFTAIQLSNYTHQPGSPWAETWRPETNGLVISDDVIKDYFSKLAAANEPA